MDNLRIVKEHLDSAIDPNAAPGDILAQNHNDVFSEMLGKVGKYVGMSYKITGGFPSVIANGNVHIGGVLNNTVTSISIAFGILNADGNDFGNLLNTSSLGDVMHIKDYEGRSSWFTITSISKDPDGSGGFIYLLKIQALPGNQNYTYPNDVNLICIVEIVKQKTGGKDFKVITTNYEIASEDTTKILKIENADYTTAIPDNVLATSQVVEIINDIDENNPGIGVKVGATGVMNFAGQNFAAGQYVRIPIGSRAWLFCISTNLYALFIAMLPTIVVERYINASAMWDITPFPTTMFYYYSFKASCTSTVRLPPLVSSMGCTIVVINRSPNPQTINTFGGANDILNGALQVTGITNLANSVIKFINDGDKLVVV